MILEKTVDQNISNQVEYTKNVSLNDLKSEKLKYVKKKHSK